MLRSLLAVLALTLAMMAPLSNAVAAEKAPSAFTDKQRAELQDLIKEYIIDNPQTLITSVETYYNKQTDSKKEQEGPLTQVPAGLTDAPGTPYAGPKNAKAVMVEFFDYNCGYCKQVATDVQRIIDDEKDVKVVFKELPILSDSSSVAARYALAAHKQGKYLPYHLALLQHQGPLTEEYLIETAKAQKIDIEKLKKDADTQDVRDTLNKNIDLARELGVRGTPFFVIGKEKIPGAIGYTRMKELLDKERGVVPSTVSTTTSDEVTPTAAPTPAPAAAAAVKEDGTVAAPDTSNTTYNAEIQKARDEAKAMIDEIKAEAARLQKQAEDTQKAEAAAAAKKK